MEKKELLFDGNEKQIYATDDPSKVIIRYKDVATAYNNIKRAVFKGKGELNNRISSIMFAELAAAGLDVHFIERTAEREQLCRKVEPVPLQFAVRNRLAGSSAKLLGVEEGFKPAITVIELTYNCDDLCDPLINNDHAVALGIVTAEELDSMYATVRKADAVLSELFLKAGIELVDLKLEFGRTADGSLIMCDEISPDNCRLWDAATGEKLDKDRFRHDLGNIVRAYQEVYDRLVKAKEA